MIDGSQAAIEDLNAPVSTIYTMTGAYKTSVMRDGFKGGKAIFTCPNPPIKCGGAPLKIMFLSEETFRKHKIRQDSEVLYYAGTPNWFPPVKKYNEAIGRICDTKGINGHFGHNLIKIDKEKSLATFKTSTGTIDVEYDFLHFVPP